MQHLGESMLPADTQSATSCRCCWQTRHRLCCGARGLRRTCRPATSCRCCSLLKLLPATSREVRSTLLLLELELAMVTASAAGAE